MGPREIRRIFLKDSGLREWEVLGAEKEEKGTLAKSGREKVPVVVIQTTVKGCS